MSALVPGWYRLVNAASKTTLDLRGPQAPKGSNVTAWKSDGNLTTQTVRLSFSTL